MIKRLHTLFILLIISACSDSPNLPMPQVHVERPPSIEPTPEKIITKNDHPTQMTSDDIQSISTTPTPDYYHDAFIENLQERKYGGGVLQSEGFPTKLPKFDRILFKYRSEGLDLYGFINIPDGEGPFPVVILLHGAVPVSEYQTMDYTARYADTLAEHGYIAINPNLRGYPPSQDSDNDFGVGDTIDTLNLISLIRSQSGIAGTLEKADKNRIGVWGHSMGGGIVLRVLTIDKQIKAGLLYASINADEKVNLAYFGNDGRREKKIRISSLSLQKISPVDHLKEITAPLSIHHGAEDTKVPVQWSHDLCSKLQALDKKPECYIYSGQSHTFQNSGDTLFIERMTTFFDDNLK